MTTIQNLIFNYFTNNPNNYKTVQTLERTFNFLYTPSQIRASLNKLAASGQITKYSDYKPVRYR